MKTNVFLPGKLPRRDGATLTIAPDDSTNEVRFVSALRFCKKRMQNDSLPDPLGPITKQIKGASIGYRHTWRAGL